MEYSENEIRYFRSALRRQAIWYKKDVLRLPYPWSDDTRFNSTFFCNVFRRQDKTTKTLVEAVTEGEGAFEDFLVKVVVARNLSNNDTIKYLMKEGWFVEKPSPDRLDALLLKRRDQGLAVHTSGFLTNSSGMEKYKLPGFLARAVLPLAPRVQACRSMKDVWAIMKEIKHVGPFMAYEYATDLSYFFDYSDEQTWSNPGPGAIRGMSRLLYGEVILARAKALLAEYPAFSLALLNKWEAYVRTEDARAYMSDCLGEDLAYRASAAMEAFYSLTMREVEHWLCEYDKYRRATHNKRRYP